MKYNLINLMTFSRVIIALIIYVLLTLEINYILALVLFLMAGLTDYFDGFLARKFNATSLLGEILDPIADKVLVTFTLFALSVNLSSYLIGFTGAIIISREIWVSALRDFNSRTNNSNATKVIFIAKIKTSIQLFTIFIYLFALAFNFMLLIIIADIFLIISTLVTLYSGYLYTLNTFKF